MPPEHDDADAYVDWLLAEVLPDAAAIASFADVFVERGTFDVEQARRYLLACREAGLALRIHGDQLSEIGAVPLAVEVGARSVDHLEATGRVQVNSYHIVLDYARRWQPAAVAGATSPGGMRWHNPGP